MDDFIPSVEPRAPQPSQTPPLPSQNLSADLRGKQVASIATRTIIMVVIISLVAGLVGGVVGAIYLPQISGLQKYFHSGQTVDQTLNVTENSGIINVVNKASPAVVS